MVFRYFYLRRAASAATVLACCLLAGCRHKQANPYAPPPPRLRPPLRSQPMPPQAEQTPLPAPEEQPTRHGREKILYSEVGIASWYGEPYQNSRAANGKIYHQDAMTAANRTLPMGSVVRVTNLATHQSVVVTVTDRGPFVPGRMIDLSRGAADKTSLRRMGIARVRMDVLRAPKPLDTGGRWGVQIGAFRNRGNAIRLRNRLLRQYPTAKVIEFAGNADYWVRIYVPGELHRTALHITQTVRPAEGQAYLVRLD